MSGADETTKNKGFVVNDRRRFNNSESSGTTTTDPKTETVQKQNATSTDSSDTKVSSVASHKEEGEHVNINFSSFVMSLAMQALMQLGEIAPPQGANIPKDKASAKQTIDIISMLKDKTTGNLSAEEEKMLTEVLHNLKMSFVRTK